MAGYVGTKAVLLSTTAANVGGDADIGGAASVGAGLTVDNDGSTVLTVDRATSDGTIIDLQKSGSSVGSIAGYGGQLIIGTGNTGLRFQNSIPAVIPRTTTDGSSDGVFDLGDSNARFKDLYLSGGVYLGGTGSANKLDDYEEGSFTPVLSGYTGVTGTHLGKYTKIGDMVYCEVMMDITALNYSGNTRITGWPFAPSKTINNHVPHGTIGTGSALNVDPHLYHFGFYATTANMYLYNRNTGAALSGNNYQVGVLGINVSYRTNS